VPIEALAGLLTTHGVPLVLLTACRSATPGDEDVTSFAYELAAAGVPSVLGMAYKVSVTTIEMLVPAVYGALLAGEPLSRAVTAARSVLASDPARQAWYGRQIDIDDWSLPVVYEQQPGRTLPPGR